MASFPKLLLCPRLQLLVVMLVVVAGLFPEKAVADEETPTGPAAPADASANGGSPKSAAEGRADKAIKCYKQKKDCNATVTTCLKPDFNTLETVTCEEGHCRSHLTEFEDGSTNALRDCSERPGRKWWDCMKEKPESCLFHDSDLEKFADALDEVLECVLGRKGGLNLGRKKRKTGALCVCDSELCNTRTSTVPMPTSPKTPEAKPDDGWNVALVVALVVVAVIVVVAVVVFVALKWKSLRKGQVPPPNSVPVPDPVIPLQTQQSEQPDQ